MPGEPDCFVFKTFFYNLFVLRYRNKQRPGLNVLLNYTLISSEKPFGKNQFSVGL